MDIQFEKFHNMAAELKLYVYSFGVYGMAIVTAYSLEEAFIKLCNGSHVYAKYIDNINNIECFTIDESFEYSNDGDA